VRILVDEDTPAQLVPPLLRVLAGHADRNGRPHICQRTKTGADKEPGPSDQATRNR
jgi:hypothetical protein